MLTRGSTLLVATHNAGKVREFREFLAPYGILVKGNTDFNLPEPEETGSTFAANAVLKAKAACLATGHMALADDSGLSVTSLYGDPGIYSARWAGEPRDFGAAMAKIEAELKAKHATDFSAKFVCVLALVTPEGKEEVFTGEVHGTLSFPPRGAHGFGYDPIFTANGKDQTFGEMDPAEKQAISHRAVAFAKFAAHLDK